MHGSGFRCADGWQARVCSTVWSGAAISASPAADRRFATESRAATMVSYSTRIASRRRAQTPLHGECWLIIRLARLDGETEGHEGIDQRTPLLMPLSISSICPPAMPAPYKRLARCRRSPPAQTRDARRLGNRWESPFSRVCRTPGNGWIGSQFRFDGPARRPWKLTFDCSPLLTTSMPRSSCLATISATAWRVAWLRPAPSSGFCC